MDTFIPLRAKPAPAPMPIPVTTEPGPTATMRSVGMQAEPEVIAAPRACAHAPAPACPHGQAPIEHKVVIEIRHVLPPPAPVPTAAAVAPPAPEPPATTWYGKAWRKARPTVYWVGWAVMQILAVINIPLIFNFRAPRA